MKLICIPHAGGAASSFLKWKPYLHPSVELMPVELAGKGRRFGQRPYKNVEEAVQDILSVVHKVVADETPYALFGHSMGALLAFELLHTVQAEGFHNPVYAFLSGKLPPHYVTEKQRHLLSDEELWNEVAGMGGTPVELLASAESKVFFASVLRHDFQLVETYKIVAGREGLDCPVMVMYGNQDTLASERAMKEWEDYSNGKINMHGFDGGHFFIFDNAFEVVNVINEFLLNQIEKYTG
ncbi:thioesterase II family protein [Paenibacillus rhizophilus]|nr:alpha/beta fold hydrolase [Paenibacillus rhizophilus]